MVDELQYTVGRLKKIGSTNTSTRCYVGNLQGDEYSSMGDADDVSDWIDWLIADGLAPASLADRKFTFLIIKGEVPEVEEVWGVHAKNGAAPYCGTAYRIV